MNRALALVSVFALLAFGTVAVGCGGDGSGGSGSDSSAADQQELTALGEKIGDITKSGDGEAFCDLFEPTRLKSWISKKQCAQIFGRALKNTPKSTSFKVKEVKVDGDNGEVTFDYGTARFEKIDGKWYAATPKPGEVPAPEQS